MNNGKTLVAAAVAATLAAPASHAAIDDAGMQYTSAAEGFYGSLRMDFKSKDKTGAADTDSAGLDVSNSRLGVRGTVDLGGGMSAGYNYEFGVNGDNGAAIGNTRLHNVGLSGGFGSVLVGTQWALDYNYVWSKTDVMNVNSGWFTYIPNRAGRQSNAITYTSPDFNGFNFGLSAVLSKGALEIGKTELYVDGTEEDFPAAGSELFVGVLVGVAEIAREAANTQRNAALSAALVADTAYRGLDEAVTAADALVAAALVADTAYQALVTAVGTADDAVDDAEALSPSIANRNTLLTRQEEAAVAESARAEAEARAYTNDQGYQTAESARQAAAARILETDVPNDERYMRAKEAAEAAEAAAKAAKKTPMFTSEEVAAVDKFVIASGYSFGGFNIAGTYVRRDVSTVNERYDIETNAEDEFVASTVTFTEVSTNPTSVGLALGYGQDNWSLGYYYAKTDMDTADNNEQLVHSFAGQMGIGKTTLRALYETQSDEADGRQDKDTDFWTLEAQYDLGSRSRVYGEYSREDSGSSDENIFLVGYRVDF